MRCIVCGCKFDYEETKRQYEEHYDNELEYDWEFPEHNMCFDCACCESDSNISAGIEVLNMKRGGHYDPNDDD